MKPNVVYYRDTEGKWRWTAKAENSDKVADSSEGYERIAGAINGFHALAAIAAAPVVEVED